MISPKSKIKIVHFQYFLSSLMVPETADLMWWTSSYKNTFQIWYDNFDNFSSKFESYFLETVTKACSVERLVWKFLERWEEIQIWWQRIFLKRWKSRALMQGFSGIFCGIFQSFLADYCILRILWFQNLFKVASSSLAVA